MTVRNIDTILLQIHLILRVECKDEILLQKWNQEFVEFNENLRYVPPEVTVLYKWRYLYNIINTCISYPTPTHHWEKRIVNVFMGSPQFDLEDDISTSSSSGDNLHAYA